MPGDGMTPYHAAKCGAVVADVSDRGLLRMAGEDALDLLHRLSTQDLLTLQPGEGTATVLTTSKGRILDVLVVQRRADSLRLHVSPGNQPRVLEWLDTYTILEDSEASDATGEHGQLLVFGPAAGEVVGGAASDPALVGLDLYHHREMPLGGAEVTITKAEAPAGGGFHVAASLAELAAARQALIDAGAVPVDDATFEVLRIEAGLPAFGSELDERWNPHEAGLERHISYTKGCYIGQEVIARLDAYDKVQRELRGLRAVGGGVPSAGSKLLAEGKDAGAVTSGIDSPDFGPIALAYVRRAHADPGARLVTDEGVEVEVAALPFN